MKTTVFLGGTCGSSTWRDVLIPMLGENVDAYNPVVPNWNEEAKAKEKFHKENDDVLLFVITPETPGTYSISEITRCSIIEPDRTVVCVIPEVNGQTFQPHEAKAWKKILEECGNDGATICPTLEDVANELNQRAKGKGEPGEG